LKGAAGGKTFWRKEQTMKRAALFIRLVLWPFGLLYGIGMDIRNVLYALGIFKSHRFNVPVFSVGNLTAGGTGKTPFTIYLARLLRDRYPRLAVVSRGYGRKTKGLQVVSDGQRLYLARSRPATNPY